MKTPFVKLTKEQLIEAVKTLPDETVWVGMIKSSDDDELRLLIINDKVKQSVDEGQTDFSVN